MYSPTIYRFSNDLKISLKDLASEMRENLKTDGVVELYKGRVDSKYHYMLFLIKSPAKPHAWTKFLQSMITVSIPRTNYLNFILILIKNSKAKYCITTGQFYNQIRESVDDEFGKLLCRKIISIEDLKIISQQCSSGSVAGLTRKLRRPNKSLTLHVENFGRTIHGFKGKGEPPPGRVIKRSDKVNWHATSSGGIFVPTDLSNKAMLPKIIDALERIEKRPDKLGLPELVPIKDKKKGQALWNAIFEAKAKTNLYLDNISDESFDEYWVQIGGGKISLPESLQEYRQMAGDDLLKKAFLLAADEERPKPGTKIEIKNRVRGTLELDGELYFASNGKWHQLQKEILPKLRTVMSNFIYDFKTNPGSLTSELPKWGKASTTEPEYLKRFDSAAKRSKGFLKIHQKNLIIEGSKYEVADILRVDPITNNILDFFFVKGGNSFHDFSYCCRQLVRSAQILANEGLKPEIEQHLRRTTKKNVRLTPEVSLHVVFANKAAKSLTTYPAHLMELQDMLSQAMMQLGFRCSVYLV